MTEKVHLDELLVKHLGGFGLYQKFHYVLVGIPSIFAGMHALSWTFSGAALDHRCLYPGENETAQYSQDTIWYQTASNLTPSRGDGCDRVAGIRVGDPLPPNNPNLKLESCQDGYAWDHSDIKYSSIEQWNLVCDRDKIVALVQALYFVGQLFGSIFFGVLSDKIGRKPAFIIAIILQLICGALLAVVPYLWMMIILRMLLGFGHPGVFIMSVVVGAELVPPRYRVWSAVLAGAFWALGEVILGALSYPLRDYRYLELAISLPAILLIIYWWILPESARWLLTQGRYEEVDHILARVAKWNGKPRLAPNWYELVDKEEPIKLSWWKAAWVLIRTPRLRIRTLISFLLWAVVTMGYYGLAINPSFMGGDNRLGFILSGILEIPALICVLSVNIVGRKFIAVVGYFLAALCLALTLAVPPHYEIANLILVVLGKSALTAVFALVYIWTPEHYPTIIRNTATGACSMTGRLGGIAASFFTLNIAKRYPEAVALTFAVLAAVAGVLSFFLPETTGEPLMETIEEAEALGIGQPIFIFGYKNQKAAAERMNRKKNNIPISIIQGNTN